MTARDYEIFKRTNSRIRRYERKENDVNQVISEFSCSAEQRGFLESVLKKIRKDGKEAEIIEIKNETIHYRITSNNEFFEELFEKAFKVF